MSTLENKPASVLYYSQFEEDKYLNEIFKKSKGLCIEVGGFDGITGSTTYFFEKLGWDCIIVEPIPDLYNKIVANRHCAVFNCAISDQIGETDFFIAEGVETLSSISPDKDRIGLEKGTISKIKVPVRTLDSILVEKGIQKIDFISIDVEGHEMSVLRGFSLTKYNPSILIVENNEFGVDTEIKDYLAGFDFVRFRITGCNEWYTKRPNKHLYSSASVVKTNVIELYRKIILRLKRLAKRVFPAFVLRWLKKR